MPGPVSTPPVWAVAVPLPLPAYDFAAPHGYSSALPLGCRVLVPWRGELLAGLVTGEGEGRSHRLREVVTVLDTSPWVSRAFLEGARTLCRLSRLPLGLLLSDLLGVGLTPRLSHQVRAVSEADLSAFGPDVPGREWQDASAFTPALLDRVREQGLLDEAFTPQVRLKTQYQSAQQGHSNLTPKQQHAWAALQDLGPLSSQSEWAQAAGVSVSVVACVLARGWAQATQVPSPPPALPAPGAAPRALPDNLPETLRWRLHGGRAAERYARLSARIKRRLELGRGVLVIAPDTSTLCAAWTHLSGVALAAGSAATLYSGQLTDVQREHAWTQIQSGAVRLVIGSALALGAPLADLSLLVVLEEGSDAHKLLSGSGVFVPDLAARMACALQTPLAWVGAVPAVESLSCEGVVLAPARARVHTVDYANPAPQPELGPLSGVQFTPDKQGYPLSHDLSKVLRQVAERGRQAALLAPRRGYSALIRCPNCEHTPQCRNCDIALRLHQSQRQLICHQCGYHEQVPERCEVCGERMWSAKGPGTEWIAAEVRKLLPGTAVYRFDKDQQDDLSALHTGHSGVVVGTQALLSQAAPPDLALIGVTLADTWLNLSDFRASERYHRLLRQLVEWHPQRAPLLVVQTFQAEHAALQSLSGGLDAEQFVRAEYELRRALNYPPHAALTQITVSAREQSRASAGADEVAGALFSAGATSAEVLGPAASPVVRLKGLYPYHILLRTRNEDRLAQLLEALNRNFKARVRVDITPRGGLGV